MDSSPIHCFAIAFQLKYVHCWTWAFCECRHSDRFRVSRSQQVAVTLHSTHEPTMFELRDFTTIQTIFRQCTVAYLKIKNPCVKIPSLKIAFNNIVILTGLLV